MVFIPFGGTVLALEDAEFQKALERGAELLPSPPVNGGAPEITDAAGMEKVSGVPSSWWLECARKGTVPCLSFGKYKRFVVKEALEAGKR